MQLGREQFLVDNSSVSGSLTVPHSPRRERRYQWEMMGEKNERQVTFHPTNERRAFRPSTYFGCHSVSCVLAVLENRHGKIPQTMSSMRTLSSWCVGGFSCPEPDVRKSAGTSRSRIRRGISCGERNHCTHCYNGCGSAGCCGDAVWSCLSYGVDVCGYLLTECREH